MEELMAFSQFLVSGEEASHEHIARSLAEWALPGDRFIESEGRFERSGLSLRPFLDLVKSCGGQKSFAEVYALAS